MTGRTRRQVLGALGLTAAALPLAGCDLGYFGGEHLDPGTLRSTAKPPAPFQVPLPRLPVLSPTSPGSYDMTVRQVTTEILPGLRTKVWSYGDGFPGPLLELRRGSPVTLRQRNDLPVPIVTHLHGGRTPPADDGFPTDLVQPGTVRTYSYPLAQRAATLWYHDHRMDHTARQVWLGLAGAAIIRDDEEDALPLPRGEREQTLMIMDRAFGADGDMNYPTVGDPSMGDSMMIRPAYSGGLQGDVILVNGAPWPVLEVAAVRYRFRLLNASNARRYTLALDPPPPGGRGFVQIGSDGGLLAAPVAHDTVPIAPAERYDVVVDFSRYRPGTTVTLRNTASDGPTGLVMRFVVTARAADDSAVPARLADVEPLTRGQAVAHRAFRFRAGEVHGHDGWVINGQAFDPDRMIASPRLGTVEIWKLTSTERHPVHLHLSPFQVLSRRGGAPGRYDGGWKDTVELTPGDTVEIATRFDGYRGRYLLHCHNLEHEDMAMMAAFRVV